MAKTLNQKRAADSLQKVDRILKDHTLSEDWKDKYAAYAESLPATILNCGLGQAAASLLAAAKKNEENSDPHYILYEDLESWLCRNSSKAPYSGGGKLLAAIVAGDKKAYLHAQAEALEWLEWHKKLAVVYLKKQKPGEPS